MQVLGTVTGTHQPGFQKPLPGLWEKKKGNHSDFCSHPLVQDEPNLVGSVFFGPTGSCSAVWPCQRTQVSSEDISSEEESSSFALLGDIGSCFELSTDFYLSLARETKIYIKTLYLVQHLIVVVRRWKSRHTGIYRKARWMRLSNGEVTAPWKLRVFIINRWTEKHGYCMYWIRRGLLHTNKQGNKVYDIQLDQGRGKSCLISVGAVSVRLQSLGCKYSGVKAMVNISAHTISICSQTGGRLWYPSEPHPWDFLKGLRLGSPLYGCAHVNNTFLCSL